MIVESSDPALAAMCPELTREQRMSWIVVKRLALHYS